VGPPIKSTS